MALFLNNVFGLKKTTEQTANVPNYRMSPMPSRGSVTYSSRLSPTVDHKDEPFGQDLSATPPRLGEIATSIRCGVGGDLVVQGPAGDIMIYLALLDGETVWGKFAAVLSTTSVDGATITTTCDDITWFGGET